MEKGKRELKKTKNQPNSTKMEKENNKKAHFQIVSKITNAEPHKLESEHITKTLTKDNYTKAYNITYIFTTIFMLLGTFFGAIVLYIYLNSIDSTSLFYKSISVTNLISFLITYLVLNFFIFLLTTTPGYLIYKKKIQKDTYIYSLPSIIPFIFIISYYLTCHFKTKEFFIENSLTFLCIITLIILSIYLFLTKNNKNSFTYSAKQTKEEQKLTSFFIKIFEQLIYFLLSAIYTFMFIFGINHGDSDCFYIIYSLLIPTLVWINNTIISDINKNTHTKKSLFQFVLFSFTTSTILMPIFIYSIAQPVKLLFLPDFETKYSDRIMQILGYQDKDNKVYYIEENFIKTALETKEPLIKVESHKTKNTKEKYVSSEYNEYSAHCGKIYWSTGDTVVFKREYGNKFIQIPANKIFEYQGGNITCDIVKVSEETQKITNIMKKSLFELLKYKPFILIKDKQ